MVLSQYVVEFLNKVESEVKPCFETWDTSSRTGYSSGGESIRSIKTMSGFELVEGKRIKIKLSEVEVEEFNEKRREFLEIVELKAPLCAIEQVKISSNKCTNCTSFECTKCVIYDTVAYKVVYRYEYSGYTPFRGYSSDFREKTWIISKIPLTVTSIFDIYSPDEDPYDNELPITNKWKIEPNIELFNKVRDIVKDIEWLKQALKERKKKKRKRK